MTTIQREETEMPPFYAEYLRRLQELHEDEEQQTA